MCPSIHPQRRRAFVELLIAVLAVLLMASTCNSKRAACPPQRSKPVVAQPLPREPAPSSNEKRKEALKERLREVQAMPAGDVKERMLKALQDEIKRLSG